MARKTTACFAVLACIALLACGVAAKDGDSKGGDSKDDTAVDSCRVNLCIAIDQGGSTTEADYQKEKESILRIVNDLRKTDGSQFLSLVGYADTAKVISGGSLEEALNATSTLAKDDGETTSGTNIGDAIMKCTENMNTIPAKHRRKLEKVIVVLTDDNPSMPISRDVATAYSVLASYAAAAENATVMTVGVGGGVNTTLLQLFSTAGPNGAPLTFTAGDWSFGGSADFLKPMLEAVCRKGEQGQAYKGQVEKPGDLTTLMISVLNGYNDAQDKTDMLLSYPEVVDNIKQVAARALNTSTTSDASYLDVVYRQDDRPESDWLKGGSGGSGQASVKASRQCKQKPVCKTFLENMACCQGQGAVSGAKTASIMVMCSEAVVGLPPSCIKVDGPEGAKVSFKNGEKLQEGSDGVALHFSASWDGDKDYSGKVTVDANSTRETDGNCQLQLAEPCEFEGTTYAAVPSVDTASFTVVPGGAKRMADVLPEDADLGVLSDSLAWTTDAETGECGGSLNADLPEAFYVNGWASAGGSQLQCSEIDSQNTAGR